MSSRLAADEKICSVRGLICSVSGWVWCTSLWRGLTNLSPCIWNFGENQCVTVHCVFVLSDGWHPLWHLCGACASCRQHGCTGRALPGSTEAAGNAGSISKPWEGWRWGLEKEESSEKMQLFSKLVEGLRRQRSLLQKPKRSGQAAYCTRCAKPRWHRGAQSMALAQDKELVLPDF